MAGLDEILGESGAIQAVRDNIRRLVGRPHSGRRMPSILIQGETGTGKGLGPASSSPKRAAALRRRSTVHRTPARVGLFSATSAGRSQRGGLFGFQTTTARSFEEIGPLQPAQTKLLKVRRSRRCGSSKHHAELGRLILQPGMPISAKPCTSLVSDSPPTGAVRSTLRAAPAQATCRCWPGFLARRLRRLRLAVRRSPQAKAGCRAQLAGVSAARQFRAGGETSLE
jgi:hypothetical protein